MARAALFMAMLLLSGCDQTPDPPSIFEGAVVVKICRDGTYVYRLADGRFMTGGWARPVNDPNTVCG